ncbi:hypothetical protein DFJ74DRAFT_703484 [Hyaloraphidium curvatum]|nr:hypothetical protein DFJ74DRAFT_703484 [Hyaloraphidium curvatum]
MTSRDSPPVPPPRVHAFDVSVERFHLREVLRALVSTVLFHRLLFATAHVRPRESALRAADVWFAAVDDAEVDAAVEAGLARFVRAVDAVRAPTSPTPPPASPYSSSYSGPGSPYASPHGTPHGSYSGGGAYSGGGTPARRGSLQGAPVVRCPLAVVFSERRPRRSWFAGSYDEDVPWEEWRFDVAVRSSRSDAEHDASRRALEAELPALLMRIGEQANAARDAIPKLTAPPPGPGPGESATGSALSASPFPWAIAVGAASPGYLPAPAQPVVRPGTRDGAVVDEDGEDYDAVPAAGQAPRGGWTSMLRRMVSDTSVSVLGGGLGGLSR